MNLWPFRNGPLVRQVKIAHRLPGRIRLSVPALTRLANGYADYTVVVEAILKRLPGMYAVTINQITANVLLQYDTAAVSETDVFGWIEQLAITGMQKYTQMGTDTNIHLKLLKIKAALESEINTIRTNYAVTE